VLDISIIICLCLTSRPFRGILKGSKHVMFFIAIILENLEEVVFLFIKGAHHECTYKIIH
jgi:hypothetical protein